MPGMSVLLPGFPVSNPLLACVSRIEAGQSLDDILVQRDQLLSRPEQFLEAAWEALGWFEPHAHAYAHALMDQAQQAWKNMDPVQQSHAWTTCNTSPYRTRFQAQLCARLDPVGA